MKESINDTIKDNFYNDIITKTKSGIYDLVSGVKNLFMHHSGNPEEDAKDSSASINNYLKSTEEIESEFRILSTANENDNNPGPLQVQSKTNAYTTIINKTEILSSALITEDALPDFMEENY